jgi:hypothetical protein
MKGPCVEIVIPHYTIPPPPRIAGEDLEYLMKKGAFSVPEVGHRNELLRCYAQFVHPFLPLIDIQDVLTIVWRNNPSARVSMLLLQAIMFAATAFIDMAYLEAQGYMTRQSASKAFFTRAKLLYDFGYEADRVVMVQALLLMTYWCEDAEHTKDSMHWLSEAISIGTTIGLNHDTSTSSMSLSEQRLWKRIWWSCYTRDRLLAISTRQPMHLPNIKFNIPMLELSDFETSRLPPKLVHTFGNISAIKSPFKRLQLAKMFIALTELCVCFGNILEIQYSTRAHQDDAIHGSTMRLTPGRPLAESHDIQRCDRDLEVWYRNLPKDVSYFAPEFRRTLTIDNCKIVRLHSALLASIYSTAISALHRPQTLSSFSSHYLSPGLCAASYEKVRIAAGCITDIYEDLYAYDLIRYLPSVAITSLSPAVVYHLLDAEKRDSKLTHEGAQKSRFCLQILEQLKERYALAGFAFSFLEVILCRNQGNINTGGCEAQCQAQKRTTSCQRDHPHKPNVRNLQKLPFEAMRMAETILFAATLTSGEKKLLAPYVPPTSGQSLNSIMTGGAATASDCRAGGINREFHSPRFKPGHQDSMDLGQRGTKNDSDQDLPYGINISNDYEEGYGLAHHGKHPCVDLNMIYLDYFTAPKGGDNHGQARDSRQQDDIHGQARFTDVLTCEGFPQDTLYCQFDLDEFDEFVEWAEDSPHSSAAFIHAAPSPSTQE